VARVMGRLPAPNPAWHGEHPDPGTSYAPYRIYNIGNNQPVQLMAFIQTIEKALGREAQKELLPLQPGDVPATYADIDDLARDVGFRPATPIEVGIERFIGWYRDYYKV
jgi:UDP-glucuronate 4-epimerase